MPQLIYVPVLLYVIFIESFSRDNVVPLPLINPLVLFKYFPADH